MNILEISVVFLFFASRTAWIRRGAGYLRARSRCSSR